ncbi:MAG: type II toxin-antitoxin system RelE family toxin [Chroococcales cyanobacterium]
MKSELTDSFLKQFAELPERVKQTARKNYKLWKQNPTHPSLEFKKLNTQETVYSVRVGIGWRAVGVEKKPDTIVWFWIGSHSEYDKLLKKL